MAQDFPEVALLSIRQSTLRRFLTAQNALSSVALGFPVTSRSS